MWDRFIYLSLKYPLDVVATAIILLCLLIGVYRYKLLSNQLKILLLLFAILLIRDVIASFYAILKHNNLFLYNLSSIIEVIITGLIFISYIRNVKVKLFILLLGIFCLSLNLFFWDYNEFSSIILTSTRLFQLIMAIIYYVEVVSEFKHENIIQSSLFWVNNGFIIQATGTFFISLFSGVVLSSQAPNQLFATYWNTYLVMNITFYAFCAVGMWMARYEKA